MTYHVFRNPITASQPDIVIFTGFLEARQYAMEHPARIEEELEADSEEDVLSMVADEWAALSDIYWNAMLPAHVDDF
jgi:hypothetical protein